MKAAAAVPAAAMLWAMGACNTSGCLENRSSVPLAGFYSMESGKAITLDSLCIRGVDAPDTTALLEPGETASSVYLPLRSTRETTSWTIAYKWDGYDFPEIVDTITVRYGTTPYFASAECGVVYHYRVHELRYTTHLIDSVGMTDSLVTNLDTERIKIYFRTGEGGRR